MRRRVHTALQSYSRRNGSNSNNTPLSNSRNPQNRTSSPAYVQTTGEENQENNYPSAFIENQLAPIAQADLSITTQFWTPNPEAGSQERSTLATEIVSNVPPRRTTAIDVTGEEPIQESHLPPIDDSRSQSVSSSQEDTEIPNLIQTERRFHRGENQGRPHFVFQRRPQVKFSFPPISEKQSFEMDLFQNFVKSICSEITVCREQPLDAVVCQVLIQHIIGERFKVVPFSQVYRVFTTLLKIGDEKAQQMINSIISSRNEGPSIFIASVISAMETINTELPLDLTFLGRILDFVPIAIIPKNPFSKSLLDDDPDSIRKDIEKKQMLRVLFKNNLLFFKRGLNCLTFYLKEIYSLLKGLKFRIEKIFLVMITEEGKQDIFVMGNYSYKNYKLILSKNLIPGSTDDNIHIVNKQELSTLMPGMLMGFRKNIKVSASFYFVKAVSVSELLGQGSKKRFY